MPEESLEALRRVIRGGLCTRCGACAGLSGGRIAFRDREGAHLPDVLEPVPDEVAERARRACSGAEVPLGELSAFAFGEGAARHPYLGAFRRLAVGCAADPEVRRAGSSGGILTAVLLHLLERGEIAGAVVTAMDPEKPWLPRTAIATSAEEIRAAAQSKYVITAANEILPEMERFSGPLAYVGLPCQVHAIRKLERAGDPSVRRVRCVFGPFCGNTLHISSIESFLRSHGVRDLREITRLEFRAGEWPGSLRIALRSGRVLELPKFHANYLIPFHIVKRCLLCVDLANELADLSGGDAWAPVYEERGKGFSLIAARSQEAEALLARMEAAGLLELAPISPEDAARMHSHGYDLKKRGAPIRIAFRRIVRKPVPDYGTSFGRFPVSRWALEAAISFLFAAFGTRPARWLLRRARPRLLGALFVRFRTLWKRATRGVKTKDLAG
mgnify:CR=1 FL=1